MAVSRWAGYGSVDEFDQLEIEQQARLIAEYETAMQIQSLLALEASRPRAT